VISGIGGLGHLAIQYAKAMGLHVCAVDIDDGKLAHAQRLGADAVVNAKDGDADPPSSRRPTAARMAC
jgi:propanol-preferring alcohol dehydrogenase